MKKAYQIQRSIQHPSDDIIQHVGKESIRLNKYISSSGFCSRREADRYIEAGRVCIDHEVAGLSRQVFPGQLVEVDGQPIQSLSKRIYIVLHKPVGITCTTDLAIPENIVSFMDHKEVIFPIGRLDKESSGLILLTNDGDIVNKILRSVNHHEKEYIVRVDQSITPAFLHAMREGVQIYNPVSNQYQMTKPANVTRLQDHYFKLILTEGLNRQIRRMCTALGYHVTSLQRTRVMNIELGSMKAGEWRYLTEEELRTLNDSLQKSTSIHK